MNEQYPEVEPQVTRKQVVKQRALNALVFLLAAAVCAQAYVLWETNQRLNKTVADLESVRKMANGTDWKVIPKSDDPTAPGMPQSAPNAQASSDPFTDPFGQVGLGNWDPFGNLQSMREQLDRMMSQMQSRGGQGPQAGGISYGGTQVGSLDLDNGADAYVVKAMLPGVDAGDVSITVEDQLLTIRVKHDQRAQDSSGGQTMRQQRTFGQTMRRIALPEPVDGAAVKWTLDNGVLTVRIPKVGQAGKAGATDPSESVRN